MDRHNEKPIENATSERAKLKSRTIIADYFSGKELDELRKLYPNEEFELTVILKPLHKEPDHG